MPNRTVDEFIAKLKADYPQFRFRRGSQDFWSPGSNTVTYFPDRGLKQLQYGLLHELAHALLGHTNYRSDFELLKMESEAWQKASEIAQKYKLEINEDHIQNCLDTYRDWLHRRSACPTCGMRTMQKDVGHYRCLNCQTEWSVTSHRFTRAYRLSHKARRY